MDRTFKINNTWIGFHNNINELTVVLGKNQFPSSLVNKTVEHYLSNFFASTLRTFAATSSNVSRTHYYKLPFVGPFSTYVQRRIKHLTRHYCKNLDIKLVFVPYKIKSLLSAKNAISKLSRSRIVYKFSCAGCSTCYVGETNRHLATHVREHLTSDKNSHIFQHIHGQCRSEGRGRGGPCPPPSFFFLKSKNRPV